MRTSKWLALFLYFSLPAAAIDACSALNPIEIAATLRGPGVVVAFRSKTDQEHFHTCFFARVSQAGAFEDNLKRFQSEAPLTLTVAVADNAGSAGFGLLKTEPGTTDTEVPGIGDRAVLRRVPNGERLFVSSGSNFLILGLARENAASKGEQDLMALAREVLATHFDGSKVAKYDVADRALANDRAAFEADPKNFAVFLMAMRKLDEARIYNLRAAAASPNDTDVLYLQGVLDWATAYQLRMGTRSRLGLAPLEPLAGPACAEVRAANREKVEEGIADLAKAVKLRPDFDDAMAYLNLLYRERADYECDDAAARAADLKSADEWVDKTMATKKANIGKNRSGNALSLPPPPPPPPPPPSSVASSGLLGVVPPAPMGGVIGGILSSAPPGAPKSTTPQRIRVQAGLAQGLLLRKVDPVYPPLARQARIQGTVVLRALIDKDGSIESLTMESGHPMLVPAAMDAVKQWQYKPYMLNGQAVEVETTILVNFQLSGG
jgi:TonB family protein